MAAQSTTLESITFTLSGITADTVSVAGNSLRALTFINHSAVVAYVRTDGTAAVAGAAGTVPIPPNFGSVTVEIVGGQLPSVVGNGNTITAVVTS